MWSFLSLESNFFGENISKFITPDPGKRVQKYSPFSHLHTLGSDPLLRILSVFPPKMSLVYIFSGFPPKKWFFIFSHFRAKNDSLFFLIFFPPKMYLVLFLPAWTVNLRSENLDSTYIFLSPVFNLDYSLYVSYIFRCIQLNRIMYFLNKMLGSEEIGAELVVRSNPTRV
jgi:hypothetical protein